MDNKDIFATNLKRQMELHGKTRKEVCDALGFSYFTFSDWISGKKYPRIEKIEALADYFGIQKSDLIEEHPPTFSQNEPALLREFRKLTEEEQKKLIAWLERKTVGRK